MRHSLQPWSTKYFSEVMASAVACGDNTGRQCNIPPLDDGVFLYHFIPKCSAGQDHTVLLRSDGRAVAFGANDLGMCSIPRLDGGVSYTQISGAFTHTVLLRSDGRAVACGENAAGKCDIPPLDGGMSYSQVSAGFHHYNTS